MPTTSRRGLEGISPAGRKVEAWALDLQFDVTIDGSLRRELTLA
jgi:hypothetical protein